MENRKVIISPLLFTHRSIMPEEERNRVLLASAKHNLETMAFVGLTEYQRVSSNSHTPKSISVREGYQRGVSLTLPKSVIFAKPN